MHRGGHMPQIRTHGAGTPVSGTNPVAAALHRVVGDVKGGQLRIPGGHRPLHHLCRTARCQMLPGNELFQGLRLGIHRHLQPLGHHPQPLDMVGMVVGDEDPPDGTLRNAAVSQCLHQPLAGYPCIDQHAPMGRANKAGIALAGAEQGVDPCHMYTSSQNKEAESPSLFAPSPGYMAFLTDTPGKLFFTMSAPSFCSFCSMQA